MTGSGSIGLGDPVRLGPLVARNRIVFPAHLTNAAVARLPTSQHAAYYGARAAGGAGLVITEEQSVDPADRPYEKLVDGTDPAVVPGYRAIADAVHAHGALVLAQLGHNGGQASSVYSRAPVDGADDDPDPMFGEVPRVLSPAGLDRVVAGFGLVASHVAAGGLDGVEVQCSQASLIRQLFSARSARALPFLRDVLRAVRRAIGPDRVLGVRVQGDEGVPGGLGTADAVRVAVAVEPLVDYVNTAVGVATRTLPLIEPPMGVPAGYAAHVPSAVRAAVSVPVIGVGRFTTPSQAAATVRAGACDLVGVVRGQIADPDFARKALAGRRVRRCIGCNQECIARVGLNRRLACAVNPVAGSESVAANVLFAASTRTNSPFARVLVVGGGPAGLAAAVAAAQSGHAVTLAERGDALGGQLALAARAPERGELAHAVADLAHAAREAGVTVHLRTEVSAAGDVTGADVVVLATGARPALPAWAAGRERVVDVTDVLAGRVTPTGRVLVVDAGRSHAATSTAELLARRGADVATLTPALVAAGDLAPTLDRERWRRRAADLGIVEHTDRVVLGARPGGLDVLEHLTGEVTPWAADWVVHAGPPTSVVPELGVPVLRVGDCVAPRDLGAAIREGAQVCARSSRLQPGTPLT